MRKLFILLAVLGLVAAACGGDSDGGANSCEGVADDAIQVIQEVIDELDSISLEELAALEDEPPAIAEMEQRADDLQAKANDLGCSDETMEELLNARVGDLEAEGVFGQLLVGDLEGGGFFE
jgi:hypothetical protein